MSHVINPNIRPATSAVRANVRSDSKSMSCVSVVSDIDQRDQMLEIGQVPCKILNVASSVPLIIDAYSHSTISNIQENTTMRFQSTFNISNCVVNIYNNKKLIAPVPTTIVLLICCPKVRAVLSSSHFQLFVLLAFCHRN